MSPSNLHDNKKLAVLSIVLAVFALSLGDAIVKQFSVSLPLWQVYVVRSLFALAILLPVIKTIDKSLSLIPRSILWTCVRSLLLACMWVAYYAALTRIKLSVAAAVYYTIPLFITLFSAWLTGDKVTRQSWLAVALGFSGVLIILRPDTDGFNSYALLPLLGAVLYALAMILTRTKCQAEDPKVLSLCLNVTFIVMGLLASLLITLWSPDLASKQSHPFLLGSWQELTHSAWIALAVLGTIVVIGSIFSAIAYQSGPSSLVASFDYSYLPFSIIWGVVFFAEFPDGYTLLGIGMIAGAGMLAVRQ